MLCVTHAPMALLRHGFFPPRPDTPHIMLPNAAERSHMMNDSRAFFTPAYPRLSWSTLYAPMRSHHVWIRFTLHTPYRVEGYVPAPTQFIPFGRPRFVGGDELMSANNGPMVSDGEALLRHIRAQITVLEIFHLSGTSPKAPGVWSRHASEAAY